MISLAAKLLLLTLFTCYSLADNLNIDLAKSPLSDIIIDPQCKSFYKAIGERDTRDPQIVRDEQVLIANSGHNLNDLGSYHQCLSNSSYHYLIMEIKVQPEGFGYIGLCSPSYCSAYDWSNETSWLQNLIPEIGGPNLSNFTVSYIDPLNLGVEKDAGSYIIFILMGALVIFTIVATFLAPAPEKKSKQFSQTLDSQVNGTTVPLMAINMSSEVSSLAEYEGGEPYRTIPQKIFQCFDIKRNFNELTCQEEKLDQDPNLKLWDGIKTISIAYITFGTVFVLSSTNKNIPDAVPFAQESWWFLIVSASVYAIDLFFFISGFLAAYILLEKFRTTKVGLIGILKIYLYRWLRLWPTYVFVILLFWKVLPFLATGPMWFQFVNATKSCDRTWWKNFIFLDTAIPSSTNDHCMIWGFYVSAEFLMFLLVPFIVWLYLKDREYAKTTLWILILISIMGAYSFSIQANLPFQVQVNPPPNINDIFNKVLLNPMVHWSTYYMGVYVGILYRNYKNGEKNIYYSILKNPISGYIVAISGFFSIMFSIFVPRTEQKNIIQWPESVAYLWTAAGRPFIVLSVWLLLLPGLAGLTKPIRNFLSWGIFNILSNLIYCCYLVHFIVTLYIYTSDTQSAEFALSKKMYLTVTVLVLSFAFGALIHLIIEKPCIMLARTFLSSPKKNKFSIRLVSESASITKT